MSERLHIARLHATVTEIVDGGVDLLPHYALAAVAVLDGMERPGEEPRVRRRLKAGGIRVREHRGVLLLEPGELDHLSATAGLGGSDEVYFVAEWNDEFEPFPGRISADVTDFDQGSPLGLEEWMVDSGCLLAVGDGHGCNVATLDAALAERLRRHFKPGRR
jgi:hypothetical protein